MKTVGIIPARYASQRLLGKPLIEIAGKSLIARVIEGTKSSLLLEDVFVATDDERIFKEVERNGVKAIMTDPELPSGSDRIFQAALKSRENIDQIVNIQGDEVFINGILVDELIDNFNKSDADAGTLIKKIENDDELFDPSVVKVSIDSNNYANYFSRSTIPFLRDIPKTEWLQKHNFYKHIGIYIYKYETLEKFVNLKQSINEKAEKLEQLRLLDNGFSIYCHEIETDLLGIDTKEDVEKAEKIFKNQVEL